MIQDIHKQMDEIKNNINNNHSPEILFLMNKKYRELDDKLKSLIKDLDCEYRVVK